MSLRDYYAGQAIAGIMVRFTVGGGYEKTAANWAFEIADAMIAAREPKKETP